MERDTGSQNVAGTRYSASDRFATNEAMSTIPSARSKRSGTDRVWHWVDQSDESQLIPETWADNAAREDDDDAEERYYAVEVRTGLQLEYRTDERGQATGVATRERPALQTLYVRADGGRAVVVESQAAGNGETVTPLSDWHAVIARPKGHGETIDADQRDKYRAAVRDLYGEEAED